MKATPHHNQAGGRPSSSKTWVVKSTPVAQATPETLNTTSSTPQGAAAASSSWQSDTTAGENNPIPSDNTDLTSHTVVKSTPLELVPFRVGSPHESSRKRLKPEPVFPSFNLNLCSDSQLDSPRPLKRSFRPTGLNSFGYNTGPSHSLPNSCYFP